MSGRIIDPTRQGITPADMPDDDVVTIEFGDQWYTLERTLCLMDTWHDGMNWGLHRMCLVLREALEKAEAELDALKKAREKKANRARRILQRD